MALTLYTLQYLAALPASLLRAGLCKGAKDRQSRCPCCLLPVFLRLVAFVSLPPFTPFANLQWGSR